MIHSQALLQLLKTVEGFKLHRYDDSAGYPTIGVGHKITNADENLKKTTGREPFQVGTLTEDQVTILLQYDLLDAEHGIASYLTMPLTQHEYDAIISFVFNIGIHAFIGSGVYTLLEVGDFVGAMDHLLKWNHAGGVASEGLTKRRHIERLVFNNPVIDIDNYTLSPVMTNEIITDVAAYKANLACENSNETEVS